MFILKLLVQQFVYIALFFVKNQVICCDILSL